MKVQNKGEFWCKLLPYLFQLLPYLLVNPTFKIILFLMVGIGFGAGFVYFVFGL